MYNTRWKVVCFFNDLLKLQEEIVGSIVLDLQQEILAPECDILNALRKAHLIATKLKLTEFDAWIKSELNGYNCSQDEIPEYRQITGQLKGWNPYHGWIPVLLQDHIFEEKLCRSKLKDSISDIIELHNKSKEHFVMTFSADVVKLLNACCNFPVETNYSLYISTHLLQAIIDKVANCLLEWTLKLEESGILGENMSFNETEKDLAKGLPQQINYYGTVINGNVSGGQVVSGNNNTVNYNADTAKSAVDEIRKSLENETISSEDMESALELLEDISSKLDQNKKPGIIRSAFAGLKDFLISAGAGVTAGIINAKMQGLF